MCPRIVVRPGSQCWPPADMFVLSTLESLAMKRHVLFVAACALTISCAADMGDDPLDAVDPAASDAEGEAPEGEQLSSISEALTFADQVWVIKSANANCPNGQALTSVNYIDNENTNNNN